MGDSRHRDREGHPEGVKVVDRRQFTRDGERRDPDAAPAPHGDPSADLGRPPAQGAAGTGPGAAPPPVPNIVFTALVHSLYMSALMALGEVENPDTHQFETNLDLARENIDILLMLEAKTRGNLTPEEQGYLSQGLPALQMLYVKKAR